MNELFVKLLSKGTIEETIEEKYLRELRTKIILDGQKLFIPTGKEADYAKLDDAYEKMKDVHKGDFHNSMVFDWYRDSLIIVDRLRKSLFDKAKQLYIELERVERTKVPTQFEFNGSYFELRFINKSL